MREPALPLQIPRIVLGFAVAPLLPAFYTALLFAQPWAFPFGILASFSAALMVGLPAFLMLRRHRRLEWWRLSLCGALCGLPVLLAYWWVDAPPHLEPFSLVNGAIVEAWGLFAGIIFWLIVVAGASMRL